MKIKETIVVEGRDDTAAIKRSVEALTIETHGYGIRPDTWDLIAKADRTTGIIVFTDPDHAGEQIRKRLLERFPNAKEAFLDVDAATASDGDIGIENASDEAIQNALAKARGAAGSTEESGQSESLAGTFTQQDMFAWGLAGCEGSSERRAMLGKTLGVGFANSKTFLQRLNRLGVSRREIEEAIKGL
ncbi:MAG: ribonuclease M5 [Clostridia bacterium]|nr:ribonuclease M5 [Clostridia bacterium]